jgi:hypothetical protein
MAISFCRIISWTFLIFRTKIAGRLALAGEALGRSSEPRGPSGDSGTVGLCDSSNGGHAKNAIFQTFLATTP